MSNHSGSPLDRLLGICFSLLIGAAAVYLAVRLVEAVLWPLLIIAGVVGVISIAAAVVHSRRNGW